MLNDVPVQEGVRDFLFQVWADVLAMAAALEAVAAHPFARALARQFLKLCEIAATGFGYLLAAVTGTGQAFHDILVGTRVVRAQETTGRQQRWTSSPF